MPRSGISKRTLLKAAAAAALGRAAETQGRPPNFIYINADDLGYGDLGCYGSHMRTPNLDSMAGSGVRFRQFYSASAVCSPSRAALMTGRYPARVGVPYVLTPQSASGLPDSEITIAQVLKARSYRTMCIGKWHLGSQPRYLPTNRGFDEYFGIPYSNDMSPLVLLRNATVVEDPADLDTLAERYTEEAVQFIAEVREAPFFLYLAPATPHLPLAASARFRGKSGMGLYGDAVEELDWSVGQVLQALRDNGIDDQTLVMFSSDNGPWFQGSAGRLRGRKDETFEGGMRMPFLASFPGRIPSGVEVGGVATTMDILPTLARLANAPLPLKPLDGVDIWPLLTGEKSAVERDAFLYFSGWNAQCARMGRWKLHVARRNAPPWTPEPKVGFMNLPLPRPELYDLEADPDESYDAADDHPEIVADIRARMEALIDTFPDQARTAWRNTMSQTVEGTSAGQWPVLHGG
jgi:arylsulfatase A